MRLMTKEDYNCVCENNEFAEEDGITYCTMCGLIIQDHMCGNTSIFGNKLIIEGEFDESNE